MKYTNRLKARLAREKLAEAAKEGRNWIVTRKLILETEEGDAEFEAGDSVEIGATEDGDMALKGNACIVIISDEDIAKTIANVVANSDELSDVEFVDRSALDALVNDNEDLDQVVDDLADNEPSEPAEGEEEIDVKDTVEVPMVKPDQKESVEAKFAKFSAHRMNPQKFYVCESILVDEESDDALNMYTIKVPGMLKESFDNYADFTKRVSELKGSIQPGKRELALTEAGEYMGSFYTESDVGEIYPENSWKTVNEMDNVEDKSTNLISDNLGYDEIKDEDFLSDDEIDDVESEQKVKAENESCLESALKAYEESAKSGADYMKFTESLEKMKLTENHIGEIVSTFNNTLMEGCVRAYDTKYGKYVAAFKESVDCNNFIEEAKAEGRFTKRFFN